MAQFSSCLPQTIATHSPYPPRPRSGATQAKQSNRSNQNGAGHQAQRLNPKAKHQLPVPQNATTHHRPPPAARLSSPLRPRPQENTQAQTQSAAQATPSRHAWHAAAQGALPPASHPTTQSCPPAWYAPPPIPSASSRVNLKYPWPFPIKKAAQWQLLQQSNNFRQPP